MTPIKIQCGCGQKYAFEVEPVNGQMPYAVACPICGTDGTPAANSYITHSGAMQPAVAVAAAAPAAAPAAGSGLKIRVHTAAPAATVAGPVQQAPAVAAVAAAPAEPQPSGRPMMGGRQINMDQVTQEARVKMMWGDTDQQVLGFLLGSGLNITQAKQLVDELTQERTAEVRKTGFRKIFSGIGMIIVAIAVIIGMLIARVILMTILGAMILLALYGAWTIIKGILMVVSPKSESGNIYEA